MNNYKKYNLWLGWLCFAISAAVYMITVEPSASFWDCAEFIATSYKLEVGHPPGAPLFMMISRFFTIFADPMHAALAVNIMSCLASAFTILFLFWSITHLARKMFGKSENELSQGETWAVMGAGLVGALAYAFTDTFWFSAVEAEVYALSSLFTAAVIWAMLQWEKVADEPRSTRWLILIAYLMGLSIGVHQLNLLTLPSLVFIFYFRKYPKVTKKGVLLAIAVSIAIIAFVLYFLVPATVSAGAFLDRIFVNSFGLPVNSGLLTFAILLFALLASGIYYSWKRGKVMLNTVMLMLTVVMLGYSSYASVVIRSQVNPPMNSNRPDNPYALESLLNRTQYGGENPLLTGHYYSTYMAYSGVKEKKKYYIGDDGKYHYISSGLPIYSGEFKFFFPRMHSLRDNHPQAYNEWANIKGRKMMYNGEYITVPTFGENLKFFFSYQINFMYWRYFLWNFVGRQNDIHSTGSIIKGQWLSGITPIDRIYLGPQDGMPSDMKENKGRNRYFFLPFILGIFGIICQLSRNKKDFTVVMWLFFMTGIAIVIYLNQPPLEPRERDYAYAGSFYAFAVWIGLGVLWAYEQARKAIAKPALAAAAATAVCLSVPVILIAQNWDDHDRSHRYVARDFGRNFLESALPNAILMNFGDNDTFPLWYSQEVEGTRYDVRIMNLSYFGAEWYVDQMQYRYNESAPVEFSIPREKYMRNNYFPIIDNPAWNGAPLDVKLVVDFLRSEDSRSKLPVGNGRYEDYIPTHTISIPVNRENVIASGIVKPEDADLILDSVTITLRGDQIERSEYMLLDILSTFDWKRPLHFTHPSLLSCIDLTDYVQFDGFTYRLVPIRTEHTSTADLGRIDADVLYDNLMNKFRYGNVKDRRTYIDYTITSQFSQTNPRGAFARLARALVERGEREKAIEVLNRCIEEMPLSHLPITSAFYITPLIEAFYIAGDSATAKTILNAEIEKAMGYVDYMMTFPDSKLEYLLYDLDLKLNDIYLLQLSAQRIGELETAANLNVYLDAMLKTLGYE